MAKILVTGASGFIGNALVNEFAKCGHETIAAGRSFTFECQVVDGITRHIITALDSEWSSALFEVDVVVHCAAVAHSDSSSYAYERSEYRKVNVDGTLSLARQSAEFGVRRFIFISTVGVYGEKSMRPLNELDIPCPKSYYSMSKLEAESALIQLSKSVDMDIVIVRPPMVYGPNAPGSFNRLLAWVCRGFPLPLGAVKNRRSFIALDNLVSFIIHCSDFNKTPEATNQIFVVSDAEDVSTTTFIRRISSAFGKRIFLFPIPVKLFFKIATFFGAQKIAVQLLCDFQVDATKARTLLSWCPVVSMEQQLASVFSFSNRNASVKYKFTCTSTVDNYFFRIVDILFSGLGLMLLLPILILLFIFCWMDTSSPIFAQVRVGRNKSPFVLYKFRTMELGTESVATHLAAKASITKFGAFLRRTKMDELPQLWNVLLGDMSLVGPRPGLFNQPELTQAREDFGIYSVRPGITGLAQLNNIDMSNPNLLAQTDAEMLIKFNKAFYFKYIALTILGKGRGDVG
jgi:nucleoside-diphosphate-sugar epimerase/lipopolysaccharide/colanic/teichoic acid biosynthesis glycosyltransferase